MNRFGRLLNSLGFARRFPGGASGACSGRYILLLLIPLASGAAYAKGTDPSASAEVRTEADGRQIPVDAAPGPTLRMDESIPAQGEYGGAPLTQARSPLRSGTAEPIWLGALIPFAVGAWLASRWRARHRDLERYSRTPSNPVPNEGHGQPSPLVDSPPVGGAREAPAPRGQSGSLHLATAHAGLVQTDVETGAPRKSQRSIVEQAMRHCSS